MASKLAQLGALLYLAGDSGISKTDLCAVLEIEAPALRELAQRLTEKLAQDQDAGLQVLHLNHKYKLTTRPEVGEVVASYFQKDVSKTLSQSALEILAIIAYRQPITRVEVDAIRGVNSSGALQTLIWRGLIKVNGKKEAPGHPNLYVTSDYFLQYFGYESLNDLPLIEDFEDGDINEAGEINLFAAKGRADKGLAQAHEGEQ